ncbi:MAG TPA: pitrilysin family protein [Steroidobacteraceae bacterium]|nr:pitrilysin family protein [Steroidobacteraceae bacterium]
MTTPLRPSLGGQGAAGHSAASLESAPDRGPASLAAGRRLRVSGREAVRAATLANGMRVIVWPVRNIPNVALCNWVRAGSRNEAPGATGLAHFFEHMMFNGTSRHPPGEFDRLMEAEGGANNAFTSDDVTVYQDWFPAGALELMLDLEADRVAHLAFTPEVIESERGVVASERRLRVEDNSHGLLAEQVQATAFVAHPYRFPTIGWPADIQSWRLEDLQAFYRTYYAPNNLTLTLAGDVDPERAIALARRCFEPIPAQAPPPPVRAVEPEQFCERRVLIRRKAQTPLLQCAYKAPRAADPRAPAVSLLLSALVEGDASRLHRTLVEDRRLAIEVSGHWQEGFDPGLLWLSLVLPEGADPEETREALDAEVATIAADGITEAELERARNLSAVGLWKKLATMDGKAQLLGEYEVFHEDWSKLFEAPARIADVSAEELRAVAGEILDVRRRTLGVLVPSDESRGAGARAPADAGS